MASFRVLFFVFSAFLWGQACSAPAPMPVHSPVPGEIVRIRPSDTDGPTVGAGATDHHYYVTLGPHPTDPNRHMVAGITHDASHGLLGPAEPLPASGPGSIAGLVGDVLLTPTSAHVQDISTSTNRHVQGAVDQEWIDAYHKLQGKIRRISKERAHARKANIQAANTHLEAHHIHNEAAGHAEAGQQSAEHEAQAALHLTEANRHNAIADEQRHGVIRPHKQHYLDAQQSVHSAQRSAAVAAQSRDHADAALRHMMAAGRHRGAGEEHRLTAVMFNHAIHPAPIAYHTNQAEGHRNKINTHLQSAAAHSPSRQHTGPDPTQSRQQAETSRLHAIQSHEAAVREGLAPAPPRQSAAAHSPSQQHTGPDPTQSRQQAETSHLHAIQSHVAAVRAVPPPRHPAPPRH